MSEEEVRLESLSFSFDKANLVVLCQVTAMKNSLYVYLTVPDGPQLMNNLSAAMGTRYDTMPISTHLIPSNDNVCDQWGESVGQKLAKRLKAQVFVSCNLTPDFEPIMQELEINLIKEMSANLSSK